MVKKKVNHKREEKMHSKVKMTSQRAENLVHVQQHCGEHLYKKNFFDNLIYVRGTLMVIGTELVKTTYISKLFSVLPII